MQIQLFQGFSQIQDCHHSPSKSLKEPNLFNPEGHFWPIIF